MSTTARRRVPRLSALLLAFCLLNAAWAVVGDWEICFGGERYHYIDSAWRRSGVFSSRGYLVIAVRESFLMAHGLRVPNPEAYHEVREAIPWSVRVRPGPARRTSMILADYGERWFPGCVVNWQGPWRGEWYNRGIAVHWLLLSAIASVVPCVGVLRRWRRRPVDPDTCRVCGYDLRATPERCPECGNGVVRECGA